MILAAELNNHSFISRDAIFITDRTQIDFLARCGNPSLENAWLIPLNFEAYGAILRFAHRRVISHLAHVDFDLCKRDYREYEPRSKSWLAELGLSFVIEGVDVVDFDAPNQFLLFTQSSYLESVASRVIGLSPAITTFYIIESVNPLPLDFYFDSDTAAGVLKFVCRGAGVAWQTITVPQRTYNFPYFRRRPMLAPNLPPHSEAPSRGGCRVGFSLGAVAGHQGILEQLRALRCNTTLFTSSWGLPHIFGAAETESLFDLACIAEPDATSDEKLLLQLWAALSRTRASSALPDSVIRNEYLDFQLRYTITKRWLRYAGLIRAANRTAQNIPLDLFIRCELCHDEGALLGMAYGAAGVPVLVAPHSAWPTDRNWTCWRPEETAVVHSRSAAHRVAQISPVARILVAGSQQVRKKVSLLQQPSRNAVNEKRAIAGNRKVVICLTNGPEVLGVPLVCPSDHVTSISLLADVPIHLRSKLLVAIRTKPGAVGEDALLYHELASFSQESVSFLEGLSFTECLQVADCVIGINLPTSGFYEVLERGIPLLHLQLAELTTLHPDLPDSAVPRISNRRDVWPKLESVLFDSRCQSELVEQQQAFLATDRTPNFEAGHNAIGTILRDMLKCHAAGGQPGSNLSLNGLLSRITRDRGAGFVDDVVVVGGRTFVEGWAADIVCRRPATLVHVVQDRVIASGPPLQSRFDVAEAYADEHLRYCGFSIEIDLPMRTEIRLSVYAEFHDGAIHEIARDLMLSP